MRTLEKAKRKTNTRKPTKPYLIDSPWNILMIATGENGCPTQTHNQQRKEAPRALNAPFDCKQIRAHTRDSSWIADLPLTILKPRSARLVSPLWPQVIEWTNTLAPGAAPVAGLRPARPFRVSPPWICTSIPQPAHASSSPYPWRRPLKDWKEDSRRDWKYPKRDSPFYIKKRE